MDIGDPVKITKMWKITYLGRFYGVSMRLERQKHIHFLQAPIDLCGEELPNRQQIGDNLADWYWVSRACVVSMPIVVPHLGQTEMVSN